MDEIKEILQKLVIDDIASKERIDNLVIIATILTNKVELQEKQIAELQSLREG